MSGTRRTHGWLQKLIHEHPEFDDSTSRLTARIVKPCEGSPYDERKSSALKTAEPFVPVIRTRLSQTPTNVSCAGSSSPRR